MGSGRVPRYIFRGAAPVDRSQGRGQRADRARDAAAVYGDRSHGSSQAEPREAPAEARQGLRRPPRQTKSGGRLADSFGPGDVEAMIDQRLDGADEADRVRQAGVLLERRLVFPARVDVEQLWVAGRAKRVNADASRLIARPQDDVEEGLGDGLLVTAASVKSRKDDELHAVPSWVGFTV